MNIRIDIRSVSRDELSDVIEAVGHGTFEGGGGMTFNVKSDWMEDDGHWGAQMLDHLHKCRAQAKETADGR